MKRPRIDIPTSVKDPELVKRRRGQIIHAAMKLFAQKGFHRTTIRDIAKRSGLSLGAIYEYIRSKEEIVVLNQEVFLDSAGTQLRQSIENIQNPLEKLRRLIHTELQLMDRYAEYLLFVTRERHYLTEKYMNMTLQIERTRLRVFDEVLTECIEAGLIAPCNVGLTTQLIKVLIDAWVMKAWDLRHRADLCEMEGAILRLLWKGMVTNGKDRSFHGEEAPQLQGKAALVVNGGTAIGKAVVSALHSKGACLTVYAYSDNRAGQSVTGTPANTERIRYYTSGAYGPLDRHLFQKILSDMKYMDFYLHDLGTGIGSPSSGHDALAQAGRTLNINLLCAQETAEPLKKVLSKGSSARCIYFAPWSWDRHANPVFYEAAKGAAVGLTKAMARDLARSSVNVNCIVPGYIRYPQMSPEEDQASDEWIDEVSPSYLGELSDVANAALFLTSDASKFLTGEILHVSREHE